MAVITLCLRLCVFCVFLAGNKTQLFISYAVIYALVQLIVITLRLPEAFI